MSCSALIFGLSLWAWWALNIRNDNQYKLEVDGLQPEQVVEAPNYYSQDAQYATNGIFLHDKKFVIDQDQPIHKGDTFYFGYSVRPPAPLSGSDSQAAAAGSRLVWLAVHYSGHDDEKFRVGLDGHGKLALIPANAGRVASTRSIRFASILAASPNVRGQGRLK